MFNVDDRELIELERAIALDMEELARAEVQRRAFLTHVTVLTPALRAECPEATGYLKSTIRCEWRDGAGYIIIDADYAGYVINGTSTNRANDFPTRAIQATQADYERRLVTEALKNTRRLADG